MEYTSIPIAKIGPGHIVLYSQIIDRPIRSERQISNESNLREIAYNGFMSPKTKASVRKFLEPWITAVEVKKDKLKLGKYFRNSKLAFVTLTLSAKQAHSDNQIKREMLGRFITECKRKFGMKNYFWRAESQENGNIHFHILVDCYMHWEKVRNLWNSIQESSGYIDRFEAIHSHRNPNSTDVHGLENLKNTVAYVVKYCCKTEGFRPIKGRIWGSSDSVKNLKPFETEIDNEVSKYLRSLKEVKEKRVKKGDGYTVIFCDNIELMKKNSPELYQRWTSYYDEIYECVYNGKTELFIEDIIKEIEQVEEKEPISYWQSSIEFSKI